MIDALEWSMYWNYRCIDMIDVLEWLMYWNDRCIDMIDVLEWLMHWNDRWIGMIDVLEWSMHWNDRCIGMIDVLEWSMNWNDWCIGMIYRHATEVTSRRGKFIIIWIHLVILNHNIKKNSELIVFTFQRFVKIYVWAVFMHTFEYLVYTRWDYTVILAICL